MQRESLDPKVVEALIKVELESNADLKMVLKHKSLLKDSSVTEIRQVYLHQSRKEEVLVMERNIDLILSDMGVREDYVPLPSGHLIKRSDYRGASYRQGGRDSTSKRTRGRGSSIVNPGGRGHRGY